MYLYTVPHETEDKFFFAIGEKPEDDWSLSFAHRVPLRSMQDATALAFDLTEKFSVAYIEDLWFSGACHQEVVKFIRDRGHKVEPALAFCAAVA